MIKSFTEVKYDGKCLSLKNRKDGDKQESEIQFRQIPPNKLKRFADEGGDNNLYSWYKNLSNYLQVYGTTKPFKWVDENVTDDLK